MMLKTDLWSVWDVNKMKPLLQKDITPFLERFCHFQDSEISSLEIISPSEIELTLTTQDKAKEYDWCTIVLLFSGISDAKLLNNAQLTHISMDDGISLMIEDNNFAFALGACYNIATLKNSSCYLIAKYIKYEERPF